MSSVKQQFTDGLETIEALTGLSQKDFHLLSEAAPLARLWADEIIRIFYDTLFDHARTAAVFHDGERPDREQTLREWYLSLFEVKDVQAFLQEQAVIGLVHLRRHVHNQYMIGIATKINVVFQDKAIQTYGPQYGLQISQAFKRILDSTVGLTAEGYEVLSRAALTETTGASPALIDRLIQQSVDDVEEALLSEK